MDDILASLDDAVLEALRDRRPIEKSVRPSEDWTTLFYDPDRNKYDWNDPEWKKLNEGRFGFLPIYLTQGYFMIVSKRDYKRMTTHPDGRQKKWQAQVKRHKDGTVFGVYGVRKGRGDEPVTVMAHRDVLRCLRAKDDVDHINGYGLDNRRVKRLKNKKEDANLILVSTSMNISNGMQRRRRHIGLLRGVEPKGFNKQGQQRYGGVRAQRIPLTKKERKELLEQGIKNPLGKVITHRSKRTWLKPELANRWYLNQIKKLSGGRDTWAHAPTTVNFPVFPPLMESELTIRSSVLRARAAVRATADVPF